MGALVDARRESRQIGRPERRRLRHCRAHNRRLEEVGLHLQQEVVAACATVDAQFFQLLMRVELHGFQQIRRLERDRLQRGARHVRLSGSPREPEHRTAGIGVPMGCTEAHECRHEEYTAGIRHARGKRLDFGAERISFKPSRSHCTTAPPMNTLPSRAYSSDSSAPGDGREQTVVRHRPGRAGILQQKTSRAVSVFAHPRLETRLAEQRRLLIAGDARDREGPARQGACHFAEQAARRQHIRQHRARHVKQSQHLLIPIGRIRGSAAACAMRC